MLQKSNTRNSQPRVSITQTRSQVGYASLFAQISFGVCPVVLCLDVSESMAWGENEGEAPIDFLAEGLRELHRILTEQEGGCPWVHVCILAFSGNNDSAAEANTPCIKCLKPFTTPLVDWTPQSGNELKTKGKTWIGAALLEAKSRIKKWQRQYERAHGLGSSKTPRIFLMTDGRTSKEDYANFDKARQWLQGAIEAGELKLATFFCCEPSVQESSVAQEAKKWLRSLFPPSATSPSVTQKERKRQDYYNSQPYVFGVDRFSFLQLLKDISTDISTQ